MKKIKLSFIALAIIAISSAFVSRQSFTGTYLKLAPNDYVDKTTYINQNGGTCISTGNPTDVCTYTRIGSNPGTPDGDFQPESSANEGVEHIFVP